MSASLLQHQPGWQLFNLLAMVLRLVYLNGRKGWYADERLLKCELRADSYSLSARSNMVRRDV